MKFSRYFPRVATILATALIACGMPSAHASSTTEAFSPSTGMMDVNYAGYMSRNDVVFNSPISNPLYGTQVGNGRVGAMVWNQSGINMQMSGVDTSEQSSFSAGLGNFQTTPAIDSGYSTFQQRLSLYNGTITTTYDSNRTVTIFGSPDSEVIGIHVADSRTGVTSATFDLSLWNVSSEPNNAQVANIATWQTVSTFANSTTIGLSRGQADPSNFGYTLAATVQGASFTTQTVNGSDVRLNITPSSSYTIWIACSSRLNASGNNSVTQAQTDLTNVESAGYAATLASFQSWWNSFWGKSFVQYSNSSGTADYLENMYYLYSYVIACGSYANYPFHFINGDFAANQDNSITQPKWPYGYWYWNERDCYNWCYASDHPEIMLGLNNLYSRNLSTLESLTTSRFGFSGVWVPETMGWNGNGNNSVNGYTKDIYSSGTEAAQNMYNYYLYTGDESYLANTAYPFMRQIAIFYQNKLSVNSSGQYWMAIGNAHETYWDVPNPITDQAAVRSLFPEIIASAQLLGQDSSLVPQWQKIVDNMAPMPTDGTPQYLPCNAPVPTAMNDENVTAELLWPYSITGIGSPDYNLILTAYNNRPFPYGNVWAPDAIQAARLGLGDDAYDGMQQMLQTYQNYPNGFTNNTNGMFEYQGVHLAAMNEQLLQSYGGLIRVFPAQPSDTTFVSSFTLLAEGGFLVSSERDNGGIKYVGIDSQLGNTATVVNPWSGQQIDVRDMATNSVILTTSAAQFSFATSANTVYVIERTGTPFSSYSHVQLTASQNNSEKTMGANVLGAGGPSTPFGGTPAPVPGTVQAENYDDGGQGVAYSVTSINGNGTAYRSDGVDIETTQDTSGGYDLGWTSTGQWFKYTVNVATAGTYSVSFRIASPSAVGSSGGSFHLQNLAGTSLTGEVTVPGTGGWQTWGNVTASLTLPAGQQILEFYQDTGGYNIDYMTFTLTSAAEGPFGGTPAAIPGTVQAENYDTGGQGIAYNVTSTNGNGTAYRSDGIDIETTSDTGGGYDLGWTSAGQWFNYTVNVATAGTYTVTFRIASDSAVGSSGGSLHLQNSNGTNLTGEVNVPGTGGWQTWSNVTANATLPAGQQVLTVYQDAGGYNLNYMAFAQAASTPPAPTGLAATGGNATVSLTWSGSSGATSYNVYRGTSSGGESGTPIATGLTGTSYTDSSVTNGTTYFYKAAAVNAAGTSGQSNEASATPQPPVPPAPSGLTATGGSATVSLTWTGSSGATSYNVYRGTTSGGESSTAIASGLTSTSYTDSSVTNGTTYFYKVAAVNAAGTSGQSNEASAAPSSTTEGPYGGTPAAIPGTVQAENYDTGGQGVAYNVTSINGNGAAYRSDGVDIETTSDTGGGYDLGWTSTGQWFKYTVSVATAGAYTVTFRIASDAAVGSTGGSFHLQNSSGTNLTGSVTVPGTGGWQTWSNVTANVTLPVGQQVLQYYQDTGGYNLNYMTFASSGGSSPPPAPTGLSASSGSGEVALGWTGSTGAASYNVYRGTSSGGESSTAIVSGLTGTSYTDSAVTGGTAYYYKVAAVDASGTSGLSNEASATPTTALPDLIVTSILWTPTTLAVGSQVVFSCVVKNQGTAPTPAGVIVGVQFAIDGNESVITWSDTDTTSLAPGASVTLTCDNGTNGVNYWPATAGTHTVQAWVNDVDRFNESNLNNNKLTASITVP